MTDAEMSRILQDFAQAHTLAKDVRVEITEHSKLFTATSEEGAKYEDIMLLGEIVRGAEHFLMWARRNGLVRFKPVRAKSVAMGSTVSPTPCGGVGERSNRSSHRSRRKK